MQIKNKVENIRLSPFLLGQLITFYQLNGQFIWEWFRKHEWAIALFGVPISFIFIWATRTTVAGFDGLLWPARFIGFGTGMIIYAFCVWYYMGEPISTKTAISLLLALILICVQVLWK